MPQVEPRSFEPRPAAAPLGARGGDEFPPHAGEWPADLSRRQFIELMAASAALAGLGGCNRPPERTIVPYVTPPDRELLDAAVYYATAMPWDGYARGLLALSRSGRPTKLEGNPLHPDSLGATDVFMQAAVLSLYDQDRSRSPRQEGSATSWTAFENAWLAIHRELMATGGLKLALLTEPTTSPTLLRCIHRLLDRFPRARWYQHTPLPRFDRRGRQDDYDFEVADVVLSVDTDFLGQHPSSLRYTRAFANRRRIADGHVPANRLYVMEPVPTLTGSMADHRLAAAPGRIRLLLNGLAATLDGQGPPGELNHQESRFLAALAADLRAKAPNVLVVAGEHLDDDIRDWTAAVNARLGAAGVTSRSLPAVRSDGDARCHGDLKAIVTALEAEQVDTVVVVGGNPVYTAPGDLPFGEALGRARRTLHLGSHIDETGVRCAWHIPESHFLESWGDLRAYDGTASIIQPLIAPLYLSRSAAEFVAFLADPPGRPDYDLVRDTWQRAGNGGGDFETRWQRWLNQGVVEGTANRRGRPETPAARPNLVPGQTKAGLTAVFRPDPTVRDGRWANNAWLQELPKPLTQLVWDNPVLVSPEFATEHRLEPGDVVRLRLGDREVEVPVWVAPGVARDALALHLGYGRTHAGKVGTSPGFDAYRLRRSHQPWSEEVSGVQRTGGSRLLVSTQGHFAMEGRDLVRTAKAADPAVTAGAGPEANPSLYPPVKYDGYRWGMTIDLGTCIGCKACVIACQAENNIPVVGKDQVARGREMHWIRVDHYYEGPLDNPMILHQPVPCMQCEQAPCELVCPVAATVHSSEGLNDMVYNRCIGTRYCSNNCPYKVRRFNFFDYRDPKGSTTCLQKNPEVTIRSRGVMEKCTYCVQRINAARIVAERENRRVRDGEVRTACQQACPAEAIVFGDLNDPGSRVRARKAEPTHYVLLEELNTQPRTTYLARISNRAENAESIAGESTQS